MTLRDAQASRFYKILHKHYPEQEDRYKKLYWKGYEPDPKYMLDLNKRIKTHCCRYGIQRHISRYIPDVELKKNTETSTMLFLLAYYLAFEGESMYKVQAFNRLAHTIEIMDDNIEVLEREGRLDEIMGIGRETRALISAFLRTGKCTYLEELTGL
jgi:hypothetical protein